MRMFTQIDTWPTSRGAPLLVLALLFALGAGAPALADGDSVYGSGLHELGDGQPPPGMPGAADIAATPQQAGPDWAELFYADGSARDDHPYDEQGNPLGNGVPDYQELYGGSWAVFSADDISLGIDFEGTALTEDERIVNAIVPADHDLGFAYVYWTTDSFGNVVIYAGAERLGDGDSTIELELNQGLFRLGHGGWGVAAPWEVLGTREAGDVLLELFFSGDLLVGVEASSWNGQDWTLLSALSGEGCDLAEMLCAVSNADPIYGGPWAPEPLGIHRFVELGVNVGALLGSQPEYATVRLRTPVDAAFGYFAEGN